MRRRRRRSLFATPLPRRRFDELFVVFDEAAGDSSHVESESALSASGERGGVGNDKFFRLWASECVSTTTATGDDSAAGTEKKFGCANDVASISGVGGARNSGNSLKMAKRSSSVGSMACRCRCSGGGGGNDGDCKS